MPREIAERIDARLWDEDWRIMSLPGRLETQRALVLDYRNHVARFEEIAEYLERAQPPALMLWGRHDMFFEHLGLSEPSVATLRRAHAIHPIAAVQTEYSLWTRDAEAELLPILQELGVALVAYSPLGRGFLAGRFNTLDDLAPNDWRRSNPRFAGDNFAINMALADRVKEVARERGCTPAQLALAWLIQRNDNVIPIPGTSSLQRLAENAAAADLELSETEIERLDEIVPPGAVVGDRYEASSMGLLNG